MTSCAVCRLGSGLHPSCRRSDPTPTTTTYVASPPPRDAAAAASCSSHWSSVAARAKSHWLPRLRLRRRAKEPLCSADCQKFPPLSLRVCYVVCAFEEGGLRRRRLAVPLRGKDVVPRGERAPKRACKKSLPLQEPFSERATASTKPPEHSR